MGEPFWVADPDFDVGQPRAAARHARRSRWTTAASRYSATAAVGAARPEPAALGDPPRAATDRRALRLVRRSTTPSSTAARRSRWRSCCSTSSRTEWPSCRRRGRRRPHRERQDWRRGPSRWGQGNPCARPAAQRAWRGSRAAAGRGSRARSGAPRWPRGRISCGRRRLGAQRPIGPRRTLGAPRRRRSRTCARSSAPPTPPSTTCASRWPQVRCASSRSPAASGRCPLKAMVPVNVQRGRRGRQALGNRISFAFVPCRSTWPAGRARLARDPALDGCLQARRRPEGREAVLGALGKLPDPCAGSRRGRVAARGCST